MANHKYIETPEKMWDLEKPIVFFGVINMDGTPTIITDEQKEALIKTCSVNGRFNTVYLENEPIPKPYQFQLKFEIPEKKYYDGSNNR